MFAEILFTVALVCIAAPVVSVVPAAFIGYARWRGRNQAKRALPTRVHEPAHSHA